MRSGVWLRAMAVVLRGAELGPDECLELLKWDRSIALSVN